MTDIQANPEIVIAILRERGNTDPFIREIVRSAILEAAYVEATQTEPDHPDDG